MAKEVVENAVTLDDIKRFAAKYGIKEFKISASGAETGMMRPMGANSFPYQGDVLVQEYNAPKNDVFHRPGEVHRHDCRWDEHGERSRGERGHSR